MDSEDDCPELVSAKVPVTILTGFLGSGKTTLLHYILTQEHNLKIAVIVNEFEFGKSIEKGLTLKSSDKEDDEWVELNNGCICCSAKSQTVQALESLCHRKGTFDLVLVETSGMADPAPVCSMFWQDDALQGTLFLSGVVTVVDCKHIVKYLTKENYAEASQQLLVADRVIFNKTDLVTEEEKQEAVEVVKGLNPVVDPIFSSFSKIDPEKLKKILFINTTNDFADFELPKSGGVVHSAITSMNIEISSFTTTEEGEEGNKKVAPCAEDGGSNQSLMTIPTTRDVDLLMKDLLYHNDGTGGAGVETFEVVRAKAAIWVGGKNGSAPELYQLQAIGEMFDVRLMAGHSVPFGVSRFLILGRTLDQKRIEEIIRSHFVRHRGKSGRDAEEKKE